MQSEEGSMKGGWPAAERAGCIVLAEQGLSFGRAWAITPTATLQSAVARPARPAPRLAGEMRSGWQFGR